MVDSELRMQTLLRQIRDLPALPDVAMRVMRVADDDRANLPDVAKTISTDQALTTRVLRMANSSFYGAIRTISTVSDAVVLLGLRTVRNLAMAASCQDLLASALTGYHLRRGDLWRHSYCCALVAQSLAKRVRYPVAEEAFVAGLLHDVGKVLVSVQMRTQFNLVLYTASKLKIPFIDAEKQILGFDHAEIGARMLEQWNLPDSLVQTTRYHHDPLAAKSPTALCCLTHVAEVVCLMLGVGLGGDGLIYSLDPNVLDILKLSDDDVEATMSEVSSVALEMEPVA
jgi:putative nucleotidyltransferase with HDIG domain